jgi:hypothetical protein
MLKAVLAAAAVSILACSAAWAQPAPRSDLAFNASDVVLVGNKHHGKYHGRGKHSKKYRGNRYGYYGRPYHYGGYYGRRNYYGYRPYGYRPYSYGRYGGYPYWSRPGVNLFLSF